LQTVEALPELQAEMDALYERLFNGEGAQPGAIQTTGAGPADTVPPGGLALLAEAFSGRNREKFGRVWAGESDGNPSDDDFFMANELAYHAIKLSVPAEEMPALLELTMRAAG